MPMVTELSTLELPGWYGLKLKGRVDAFNDRQIIQTIENAITNENRVALDLSEAEFVSLQLLRALSFFTRKMSRKNGQFALVRPSHNVRRQIEIFFGHQVFLVFGSPEELQAGRTVLPRAEFRNSLHDLPTLF